MPSLKGVTGFDNHLTVTFDVYCSHCGDQLSFSQHENNKVFVRRCKCATQNTVELAATVPGVPAANIAMDAISALRDLVQLIDDSVKWADVNLSEIGADKLNRAKDVLKQHQ